MTISKSRSACARSLNTAVSGPLKAVTTLLLSAFMLGQSSFAQSSEVNAPLQFISVGTGSAVGVYYPTGTAICRAINKRTAANTLYCNAEQSGGSIANLNALVKRKFDLGIAQADSQYHAYHGTGEFQQLGANRKLRSVLTLYTESFSIVASKRSGIRVFDDLAGKRVNIGNPGSGQRLSMQALMQAKGWSKHSFASASELSSDQQAQALCNGSIDAFVFSAGHPSASLKQVANECDIVMVAVDRIDLEKLTHENHYYSKTSTPSGMYRGVDQAIATFGMRASLLASSNTSEDTVYNLVKTIMSNLETVKEVHPVLGSLDNLMPVTTKQSVPIHPGAQRYFNEASL